MSANRPVAAWRAAVPLVTDLVGLLVLLVLVIAGAVVLLSANNYFRNWPAARLEYLRSLLTMLLIAVGILAVVSGRLQFIALLFFLALPLIRNMLDPKRGEVTEEAKAQITSEMTRDEALRILELDEDEATGEAIEAAYLRLMKLVHPDRGGTTYFAAKLNAARDYLKEHPVLL